ncbi:MAG: RNA polymerase sigma factor SigZ [Rhodocyclaceae bacterium]
MNCIVEAWQKHETELRRFLRHRSGDDASAEDLLQEVFLRALRQKNGLCGIDKPRAWLFQTARNLLIDRLRLAKEQVELPDDLAEEAEEDAPVVDSLTQCLPRVLSELSTQDREAIELCDLEGMSQREYARRLGLSLPAAKSRVQRARARLKARMSEACQVSFDAAGKVEGFVPRPPSGR